LAPPSPGLSITWPPHHLPPSPRPPYHLPTHQLAPYHRVSPSPGFSIASTRTRPTPTYLAPIDRPHPSPPRPGRMSLRGVPSPAPITHLPHHVHRQTPRHQQIHHPHTPVKKEEPPNWPPDPIATPSTAVMD
jgi:hypothetical protein